MTASLANNTRRTLWAIADQCVLSGGNFATNLVLLRTLVPAEFGTYALILNAIIFFNNVQQALINYPLCVRGAKGRPSVFRRLLSFSLFATVLFQLLVLTPALSLVARSLDRSSVILAAILAMTFWQLQEAMRASFLAKIEQRRALLGDSIGYLGQAILIGLICLRSKPSLNVIFLVVAGTSVAAFAVQNWQTRPLWPGLRMLKPMTGGFWLLGRWNVVAKLLGFFTLQAFPWLILLRHGRVEVAAFQAIFQFLAFSNPLLFSIGGLITSTVARHGHYRDASVRHYVVLASGVMVCYLVVLGAAGPWVMRLLYGAHSPYLAYSGLMPIFAIAWSFVVLELLVAAVLGGLREPRSLFLMQSSGTVAALVIAVPWIYWKGLTAAAFSMILVNAARGGTGVVLLLRRTDSAPRIGNIKMAKVVDA